MALFLGSKNTKEEMKKIYFGNKQVQPNDFYDFVEKINTKSSYHLV